MPAATIAPAAPWRRRAVRTGSNDCRGSIAASSSVADMSQRYPAPCRPNPAPPGYHAAVPEGEAIHRTAAALRTALVGRAVLSFEAPLLEGPVPAAGRVIELVESRGKQLDMVWDDGLILHTSLFFGGAWHLYRTGERWRKPSSQLKVGITVDGFAAVCFGARTVETYREFDTHRHPGFGRSGPDLSAESPDLNAAVEALCGYTDVDAPIAEAMLDQQVACGVGNVFRSEGLWACRQHPFAPVSILERADVERIMTAATKVLHAHVHPGPPAASTQRSGGLAVYGRNGQPCPRCGDTVEVRRLGEQARLLYWCPGCQVQHGPRAVQAPEDDRPMDPHPAAAKFLAELPWRRRGDSLAG
jgi:endonuclease-8